MRSNLLSFFSILTFLNRLLFSGLCTKTNPAQFSEPMVSGDTVKELGAASWSFTRIKGMFIGFEVGKQAFINMMENFDKSYYQTWPSQQ
ncbi:MAG: hypothetical protein R2784_20210 [Saprospiraceae bacterium]